MNSEKYVFVSYAHKDSAVVLPCVEAMKKNNINLWFDEGIQAGSEWPEYIAEKVMSCSKFVLFVSRAYLESQNCKRELNFAISQKKDVLSVFIEEVTLSPGMEMQLGTYQSIFKNRFTNDKAFHDSLSSEKWFNPCKKEDSNPVSTPNPTTVTPNQQTANPVWNQNQQTGNATWTPKQQTNNTTWNQNQQTNNATWTPKQQTNNTTWNQNQQTNNAAWTPKQQTNNATWAPKQQANNAAWTPKQQTNNATWNPNQQTNNTAWNQPQVGTAQNQKSQKSRVTAAVFAMLLGGLGIHYFYLKDTLKGILSLLFCWTYIPSIISFCIGIYWLTLSDEEFEQRIVNKVKK